MNRDQVALILNKHDPIGLIRMGAPLDEYFSEAAAIVNRLPESTLSEDDALDLVYDVFAESFNYEYQVSMQPDGTPLTGPRQASNKDHTGGRENYREIAREIAGCWRKQ